MKEVVLAYLANLPVEELESTINEAKVQQVVKRIESIPPALLDSFKELYKRFREGQTFSIKFTLPVELEVKVSAEHEYGHPSDYKLRIDAEKSDRPEQAKWFVDTFSESLKYPLMDDPFCLESLTGEIGRACAEETDIYSQLQSLRRQIRDRYQVEPFDLIKD